MPVIEHSVETEIQMRPGIRGQFLANKELGASDVGLLVNTAEPGVEVPLHMHTVDEVLLVLQGTLWVRMRDERFNVGPRQSVIIPASTPHAWGNEGPEVAKVLFAFGGPDPFADAVYLDGEAPKYQTQA